jgi:hypothetical protein
MPPQCRARGRGSRRWSVRPSGAAQPPAAPDGPRGRDANTVLHRSQHPPDERGAAAIAAASSGGFAINRWPGGHTGRASRGGPRGRPFHGLDSVEDTRTRHVAPSPVALHRDRSATLASRPAPPNAAGSPPAAAQGEILPGVQRSQGRSRYEYACRTGQPSARRSGTVTRCGAAQPLLPVASARKSFGHRVTPGRPRATARCHLISSDRTVWRTPPGGPAGLLAGVETSAASGSGTITPRSAGRRCRC